jgi:hypothetical protein
LLNELVVYTGRVHVVSGSRMHYPAIAFNLHTRWPKVSEDQGHLALGAGPGSLMERAETVPREGSERKAKRANGDDG